MSIVSWLTDRLHVGASDREVVEYVLDRVKYKDGPKSKREVLAEVAHEALAAHARARGLYDSIYGGGASHLEAEITERLYGGAENRAAIEAAESEEAL